MTDLISSCLTTVPGIVRHLLLLELPFARELGPEGAQILDDFPAGLGKCLFGGDGAVGLDAELEGGGEGMGDSVAGESDNVVSEEAGTE